MAHGFELLQGKKDIRVTCVRRERGAQAQAGEGVRGLTWQAHLVQLSTTQVSFSAKNRPSCQQADTFLVFGGPPMSSQRNWLSLDWKIRGWFKFGHGSPRSQTQTSLLPQQPSPSRVGTDWPVEHLW